MIGSTFVRKKVSIIDNHMAVAKWNLGYCFPQSCIWRLTVNGGPGGRVDWRAVFPIKIHEFLSCRQDGCKTGRAVEEGELMGCRKRLAHVQHIGPPCCAAHRPALSAARQPALLWWPPAHPVVLAAGTPFFKARQRRPESLFQTPTPLLFQNFWIRVWLFFKFENPTPDQNPVTIIDPIVIYSSICLRNDHTDSCYCRNWKVTPGPVFLNFCLRIRVQKKNAASCGVDSDNPNPVTPLQPAGQPNVYVFQLKTRPSSPYGPQALRLVLPAYEFNTMSTALEFIYLFMSRHEVQSMNTHTLQNAGR